MSKLLLTIILLTCTTHQLNTQGLQNGDQRYLANDSYVGREISCSEEEKICLTFGLLYDAEERRCKKLGDSEVGEGAAAGSVSADRNAFSEGSLRATRRPEVPCPRAAPEVRMAFDGGCRDAEALCGALCPEGRPALNLFGGWECRCSRGAAVRQPLEAGRCAVPRFGDDPSSASRVLQCSRQQRECFSQGKVRFRSGDACHELLQRGRCPENHILALSEEAADGGRVEVICVRNPCGPGKIRTSSDGHCYDRLLAENLLGNVSFSMNWFGYMERNFSNINQQVICTGRFMGRPLIKLHTRAKRTVIDGYNIKSDNQDYFGRILWRNLSDPTDYIFY